MRGGRAGREGEGAARTVEAERAAGGAARAHAAIAVENVIVSGATPSARICLRILSAPRQLPPRSSACSTELYLQRRRWAAQKNCAAEYLRGQLRAHVVVLRSTPRFPMRSKSSTASFHLRGGAHAAIITL